MVEEQHAQVLDTPGLAKLWRHQVPWLQGGSRASKLVLAHARCHQGHQTCAGAYKRPRGWKSGGVPNTTLPSHLATRATRATYLPSYLALVTPVASRAVADTYIYICMDTYIYTCRFVYTNLCGLTLGCVGMYFYLFDHVLRLANVDAYLSSCKPMSWRDPYIDLPLFGGTCYIGVPL